MKKYFFTLLFVTIPVLSHAVIYPSTGLYSEELCIAIKNNSYRAYLGMSDANILKAAQLSPNDQSKIPNSISNLQRFLIQEDHATFANATGYFGPATRRAVQNFQRTHGIRATGTVGPQTREKIKQFVCGGGTTHTVNILTRENAVQKWTKIVEKKNKEAEEKITIALKNLNMSETDFQDEASAREYFFFNVSGYRDVTQDSIPELFRERTPSGMRGSSVDILRLTQNGDSFETIGRTHLTMNGASIGSFSQLTTQNNICSKEFSTTGELSSVEEKTWSELEQKFIKTTVSSECVKMLEQN